MSLLRQSLKDALATLLPPSVLLVHGPRQTNGGVSVSLTFDDGPHPEITPRLLDELAAAGMRATFFVIGELAQRHPELVRRIVNDGHELGNHTWTHSEPRSTSTAKFLTEVRDTRHLLEDLSGQACRLVRPPKGELSVGKLWGLMRERLTTVLWNRDTKDYRMQSASQMEAWCRTWQPSGGDIVLLHDNRPHCLRAIECLRMKSSGNRTEFVTISEMSGWSSPEIARSASEGSPEPLARASC